MWHQMIAPMHIAQGSPEVYSVLPPSAARPRSARQRRIAHHFAALRLAQIAAARDDLAVAHNHR
jgi:hypothetical protein